MRCRLCGGSDLRPCYTQGNRDEFRFFRCRTCRLVNYDLSTGIDQAKYSRNLSDPRSGEGASNSSQTSTFEFILRRVEERGSLLDIGCGNGRLLYLATADGWTAEGIEISPEAAAAASALSGAAVRTGTFPGDMPALGRKYDLVVLRHVLEHIPDPPAAMSAIGALLADGGRALFEFPNIDGLDARWRRALRRLRLYRKRYPSSYVPGHCCEYCRESFETLLERSGMVLEHWETYSMKPLQNALFHLFPVGGKARALVRCCKQ
jgi:SAM-dependent methyltransferase